jgi:hypothetical protein
MDLINPRSPADAVWSRFFGVIDTHDTNLCGLFVLGDVMFVDEKTTISPSGHSRVDPQTLEQLTNL